MAYLTAAAVGYCRRVRVPSFRCSISSSLASSAPSFAGSTCWYPQQPKVRSFSVAGMNEDSEDEHKVSPKFGKSTVTQELWRRREADSMGISAASHAVAYRFSAVSKLRDEYIGNTGKVLFGRMLEDLDALAGNVAFDWCSDTKSSNGRPLILVTAAVGKIRFERPININEDVILEGDVIWTGSSSLFVRIHMRTGRKPRSGEQLLEADFIYVALDHATKKVAPVPQVKPSSEEEKALFSEAQGIMDIKKALRKKKIQRADTPEEWKALTDMVARGDAMTDLPALSQLRTGQVLMQRTVLENTELTKPQDQNTAGNVFGGKLMRSCYELAFATAYAFSGRHPKCLEVSEFVFERPVAVGALLRLHSRVVLTVDTKCCVEVLVKVIEPGAGISFRADKITVVFDTGGPLIEIVPATINEARAKVKALNYMQGKVAGV